MASELAQRRVEKLWRQGLTLLERGEYEQVLGVSERLEQERYSGAFDLAAQAYAGLGQLPQAIAVLERGVELAPGAWLNWQLLGNYRSEADRFDEAAAAYERALECKEVWVDSIRLNQSILAKRRGRLEEALRTIELVGHPDMSFARAGIKASLLLALGKPAAAIEECTSLACPDDPAPADLEYIGGLCVTHAKALLALGTSTAVIYERALAAVRSYPGSGVLLSFLRTLRDEPSEQARVFGVTVAYQTDAAGQPGPAGFIRAARVAADSPTEALSIIREIEGDAVLALDGEPELEVLEERFEGLKGLLSLSPRHYYAAHDE